MLTTALRDSLGGNCRTVMVANVAATSDQGRGDHLHLPIRPASCHDQQHRELPSLIWIDATREGICPRGLYQCARTM